LLDNNIQKVDTFHRRNLTAQVGLVFQIFRRCVYVTLRTLRTDMYGFYSTLRYVAVSYVTLMENRHK